MTENKKDLSTQVAIEAMSEMITKHDISFYDILEIRKLVEPKVAELATQNAQRDDLDALEACIRKMEAESHNTKAYQANDTLFHEILAKASGNLMLYTIVSAYSALLIRQIQAADGLNIPLESTHHFHREIYNRMIKHDPKGAREQMLIHLGNTEMNLMAAGYLG